jgi:hypothetical protein
MTHQPATINRLPARNRALKLVAWSLPLVAGLAMALAAHAQGVPSVGQVVFVSGPAQLVTASGSQRPVQVGAALQQGDRVVTGTGAYVHLRMIDNAFVAVRPESRLAVELYEYDAARPQASRIKLQLDNGNARTVSGKGGEAARQNYRFNTPMAAIGLRGTDYTVRSTDDATRVSVSRGAVAVTPLGEGCSAGTLGPCATGATRELTAAVSHAYLEVSSRNRVPVLVRPEQDPQGNGAQNPAGKPDEPRAESKGDVKLVSTNPKDAASQVTADRLVAGAVPVEPPKPAELVWGRWATYATGPGSPGMSELLGPEREIVVGNNVFGLLRPAAGPVTLPVQGNFSFQMAGAEAYTLAHGVASPAQVLGGNFSIDFNQRAFSTALSVQHGGGTEQLGAQGRVQYQGLLIADPSRSNMVLNGAVASGGTEAAYLFEKTLTNGGLLGAVRWVR